MAKIYALEVKKLYEFQSNGHVVAYWSKGHHDKDAFLHAIEGLDVPDWIGSPPKPEHVAHVWRRCTPDGDYGYFHTAAGPNTRGAFPVTVFDFYKAADYELEQKFALEAVA